MTNTRRIRDRVADTVAAAQLLCDTPTVVSLAAEALSAACPRGFTLAYTRRADDSYGSASARFDGVVIPREALGNHPAGPWIVDVDRVPDWQRNCWVEPIHAGVHGQDYFSTRHPATQRFGAGSRPDYGRMMVCHDERLIAWIGVMIDSRYAFRDPERAALTALSSQLVLPLRIAAALDGDARRIPLAPRQDEVMCRVALGWTNKRIARDLGISPATVKTVLERLFRVSGSASRTALVGWWRRR
jgi:DNA-binding CsgD family transcriptional regulator